MTKQQRFFRRAFPTPGLVRLGIWLASMLGDSPVDPDVSRRAGFPEGTTNFTYADSLVAYAESRGWGPQIQRLLAADIREALDAPDYAEGIGTFDYLESRGQMRKRKTQNA